MLRDDTQPHTTVCTVQMLHEFKLQLLDHARCSPDLTTNKLHYLLHINIFVPLQNFADRRELNSEVER
jgi:hypothetical protein